MTPDEPIPSRLAGRVRREKRAYEDGSVFEHSSRLQRRFIHVFESFNRRAGERAFWEKVSRLATGAVVLDYGCYDGWMMERLLPSDPDKVIGIDISEAAIRRAIERYGTRAAYQVMDGHRLAFEDETFDLVVGRSILHHLDFAVALEEIHRVLKPGGQALFIEPLGGNPVAKVLRALTPRARTPDEKPLGKRDIQMGDALFETSDHLFFNLFSVPVGMATSLVLESPENLPLRITHWIDSRWGEGPLRHWMQYSLLHWSRRGRSGRSP